MAAASWLLLFISAVVLGSTHAQEPTGSIALGTLDYTDLDVVFDDVDGDYETGGEDLENLLNTDEPEPCGSGKNCIAGKSECIDGKCKCVAPYKWSYQAVFSCYYEDALGAEVKNDPSLVTFDRQKTKFPFPCRYMLTHVKQPLKNTSNDIIGSCEFQVFGFNAKRLGKFFVLGFDVAVEIKYDSGKTVSRSSRSYGVIQNKLPQVFSSSTRGDYLPDGPWESDSIEYKDDENGVWLRIYGDNDNKQIVLKADGCGFGITFVPYDVTIRRIQFLLPGISISVTEEVNVTEWYSNDTALALTPAWGDIYGRFKGYRLQGLTDEQSLFVRAFTRNVEHNHPLGSKDQCDAVGSALNRCDDDQRENAFDSCYWMVKEPRFMRCYDPRPESEKIMKLFESCIDVWCNAGSCQGVMDDISYAGCDDVRDIRSLRNFMRGNMCP